MALGANYATTANLKTRLGITDANDDTVLGEALTAASRSVEKYCRRQFNDADTVSVRSYYPLTARLAMVDDFHTITGLVIKVDTDDDGTFETIWAAGDYQLEPLDGIVDGVDGWPFWRIRAVESEYFYDGHRATLQVTARWGWSAVPALVKEATLILAEEIFKLKDAPFGVAGFSEFGSVRVRENPKVVAMLKDFRRTAVRVA